MKSPVVFILGLLIGIGIKSFLFKTGNTQPPQNNTITTQTKLADNKQKALETALTYSKVMHCAGRPLFNEKHQDKNVIILDDNENQTVYGVFQIFSSECEFGTHSDNHHLTPVILPKIDMGTFHIPSNLITDDLLKNFNTQYATNITYDEIHKQLTITHLNHDVNDGHCCPTLHHQTVIDFSDWQNPKAIKQEFLEKKEHQNNQDNTLFNY